MLNARQRKFDEGGIVKGKSHADGGEHFIVNGSGQHVELEGREAVISSKAFEDEKIHRYKGTNWEILNQINEKYGGNNLHEKVETIGVGDFVICISSVEDDTIREYTGTNEQVISAINESGGCISVSKGAKVKEILDQRRKMKGGGKVQKASKPVLKTSLKILKKKLEENPTDKVLKARIKVVEKMLESPSESVDDTNKSLLAPNGKPSNLTPEQYSLVRTPEFKAWFGDWESDPKNASKVVDENGEPLVVYRGDAEQEKKGYVFKTGFNRLKYTSAERGTNDYFFHFVDKKSVAEGYAEDIVDEHNAVVEYKGKGKLWTKRITPYFLNIRKLIDITPNNPNFISYQDYLKQLLAFGRPIGKITAERKKQREREQKEKKNFIAPIWYGDRLQNKDFFEMLIEAMPNMVNDEEWKHLERYSKENDRPTPHHIFYHFINWKDNFPLDYFLYKQMKQHGYDGMLFLENTHSHANRKLKADGTDWLKMPKVYTAFEPNQIKLADGSNTTFDDSNPDIRFDEGGNVEPSLRAEDNGRTIYYYDSEGNKVGYTDYYYSETAFSPFWNRNEHEFYLDIIEVYPEYQGKGYSHFMLEYVKDVARKLGATILTLRVDSGMGECGKDRLEEYRSKLYIGHGFEFTYDLDEIDDDEKNPCAMHYRIAEVSEIMADGGAIERKREETYKKWKQLVNMSSSELERFYDSDEGKEAGLTASEARRQGIGSGRESARWILRMKHTPKSDWTDEMWRWAGRQVSFISRMSGNRGPLYDYKGRKTRKHLSLLIWGHNPKRKKAGGKMDEGEENYGKPNVDLSDVPFIHEASKEVADKILKQGFIIGTNKNVTLGIYTIPIVYKLTPFDNNATELEIYLKPNSKIFWTNTKVPMDFYYGIGNRYFNDLFTKLGGKKDDSNRLVFLRNFENWLSQNDYCGVQQGGEVVITDLSCIDSVAEFERNTNNQTAKRKNVGGDIYHLGGDMSKHLAPNGKPSNLTHEQWHLVRTPEFKAWFGDWENDPQNASKVVDENGEPLVVYHGTRARDNEEIFNVFDLTKGGESNTMARVGFWFTPIKSFAYNFSEDTWWGKSAVYVYSVFLNFRNPKVFVTDKTTWGDSYEKFRTDVYKIAGKTEYDANVGGIGMALTNAPETIKQYRNQLQNEGFDGIVIKQTRFDRREAGGFNDQYVALFSEQIKLADGSNTTFDESNPDIRFKEGGRTIAQTPAPKSEQITGSDVNEPESASSGIDGDEIQLSDETISKIKTIISKHNEAYPKKKITIGVAKAVVRRGMGAYSSSHRPTISGGKPNSRVAWGLARLNAFVYKAQKGYSKSGKYSQDNDLLSELKIRHSKFDGGGEVLHGGKADGKTLVDIANMHKMKLKMFMPKYKKGIKHELEHTDNKAVASEIAKDHLFEDPEYYNKLDKIEHDIFADGGAVKPEPIFKTGGSLKKLYYSQKANEDSCFCDMKFKEGGSVGSVSDKLRMFVQTFQKSGDSLSDNEKQFVEAMKAKLIAGEKLNKVQTEKLSASYGIESQMVTKELTELAIILVAKKYAQEQRMGNLSTKEVYDYLVELYNTQPNLSHRSSTSVLLQQYSTPAPIGYLMGLFCEMQDPDPDKRYLEPSAGNGMLTLASASQKFDVNEISELRIRNLRYQNYNKVTTYDASVVLNKPDLLEKYDAVITNPPFGSIEVEEFSGYGIKSLEHVMAIHALAKMKQDGRAAIIVGGHVQYDERGRIKGLRDREFISYLYDNYQLVDIINLDGHKLYQKMGTGFNVRILLVKGRYAGEKRYWPLVLENENPENVLSPKPIKTFEELWERVYKSI